MSKKGRKYEWVDCPDCGGNCKCENGESCCRCKGKGKVRRLKPLEGDSSKNECVIDQGVLEKVLQEDDGDCDREFDEGISEDDSACSDDCVEMPEKKPQSKKKRGKGKKKK